MPAQVDQTPTETGPNSIGGIEVLPAGSFESGVIVKAKKNLMYPINMNSSQDRILITQLEYKRSDIVQQESDFSKLNSVGSVTLPMPNDISESNTVGWGEDSLSNLAKALMPGASEMVTAAAGGNVVGFVQEGFKTGEGVLSDRGISMRAKQFLTTRAAAGLVQKLGINVNPEAYIARATGAAINPNLELLFNGPKLRQFGFQFKMTPRSQKEAAEIRRILRFFKKGMSPKRPLTEEAAFFLGAPNVFKIKFKSGNSELKSIGQIKTCALVSFNANYTPDGFYAAFEDSFAGGSQPISVTMQMGFTELTPVFNDEYGDNINELDDVGPNNFGEFKPKSDEAQSSSTATTRQGGERRSAEPQGQLGGIDVNSTNTARPTGRGRR